MSIESVLSSIQQVLSPCGFWTLLHWTLELWEGAEGGQMWVRGLVGRLLLCAARDTLRRAEFRAPNIFWGFDRYMATAHANLWTFRARGQQPGSELNLEGV